MIELYDVSTIPLTSAAANPTRIRMHIPNSAAANTVLRVCDGIVATQGWLMHTKACPVHGRDAGMIR